jgi:hypothetical protein
MPQPDRAWWDDVQYLREPLERKREKEARRGLRLDARAAARAVAERHAGESIADAENVHELDAVPRRRFERAAPERRGRFSRGERGTGGRAERGTGGRAERGTGGRAEHGVGGHAEHDSGGRGAEAPVPLPPPSRRRTVEITGRTVGAPALPRLVQIDRRRPARRAVERVGARPDRLALWAVVLAFFLIFVAVTSSSHAATRAHGASAAAGRAVHQQHVQAHTATLRAIPPAR